LWASCRAAARVAKVWLGQLPPCAPCAADQCLVGIGYFPSRRRSSGACHSANGGYADIVAAGEFVERSALHTATAGLFLLYRSECRGSAHVLSLGLGAASAVGGAGADKVALHVASPPNTAIISRPVLVPVSAHGSASERNCGLASTICLTMAQRCCARRRSMRVTVTTSPGARVSSILRSWRRSLCAPVTFSRKILVQPTPRSCSGWASSVCPKC
jgi:hypothetical protein